MKIKYLLPGIMLSASLLVSCGEAKVETTESDSKEEKKKEEVKVIEEEDLDEYSEGSIQSQWDDIVAQVKAGEKENLNMYLDKSDPAFSQAEWDLMDFSQPEYAEAFTAFNSYDEIPEAGDMEAGNKVINVNFETEMDGEVFESTAIIYLVVEDGLLWINGCMLAG